MSNIGMHFNQTAIKKRVTMDYDTLD
jgi:hypothetical protein